MFVTHPEQGDRGKMRSGGLASDEQPVGAELVRRVVEKPAGRRLAIVRPCRIRIFRCEAVGDADHRDVAGVDDDLVERVHHFGRARHPRAAVDMEEHAVRLLARERAELDRSGGSINRAIDCPVGGRATKLGGAARRDPLLERQRRGVSLLPREGGEEGRSLVP